MNRSILVVFSDTHGGSKMGLLNPETLIQVEVPIEVDGQFETKFIPTPVSLNPYQNWLWEIYEQNIEETMKLANGDPVAVFHNGDLTQGVKYRDGLQFSDIGSQLIVGASNMRPWFQYENVKWFRIVWGTDSHIMGEGTAPRIITQSLQHTFPNVDIQTVQHSNAQFSGLLLDIAHHGPTGGGRSWLRGNELRYYTKSLMDDHVKQGKKPPDIIVRSHYHIRVEEYVTEFYGQYGKHRTIACITPSYQGMNEYARQQSKSSYKVINGHVAFEIVNGKVLDVHWFANTIDTRTKEVLK